MFTMSRYGNFAFTVVMFGKGIAMNVVRRSGIGFIGAIRLNSTEEVYIVLVKAFMVDDCTKLKVFDSELICYSLTVLSVINFISIVERQYDFIII